MKASFLKLKAFKNVKNKQQRFKKFLNCKTLKVLNKI